MDIIVSNLGVISQGKLSIEKDIVNIKYGINGSGKSTIAKGLELFINNDDLGELKPFGIDVQPIISMNEKVSNIIVFNQDYVNNYLFKDDIANNSFEIMINTNEYKLGKKRIENMFVDLVTSINNVNTKTIVSELESLKANIPIQKKITKTKGIQYSISASSKFMKAKKIANLDEVLDEKSIKYKDRLKNNNNHEWLKWFIAGQKFIEENRKCPFCLHDLETNFDETVKSIESSVNSTGLKQNLDVKETVSNVEKYMTELNREKIQSITNKTDNLSSVELKELYEIVNLCNTELTKLNNLSSLNVSEVKKKFEEKTLMDFLENNILELKFYENLSDEIKSNIEKINKAIQNIIYKSEELSTITKDFAEKLNKLVESKKEYINEFLNISGIPYKIDIVEDGEDDFKTVLYPLHSDEKVTDKCLSFGEKNAISLILFSLEACKNYELIVLDDPVSSFDNNKKFAILYYLFTKTDAVFKSKTVLLFTHDFDIIVDFIYKEEFKKIDNKCSFVKNNNGNFDEKQIKKNSVSYTIRLWRKKAENPEMHPLLRVVNLRKYLQYTKPGEETAKNILSSLEHNDNAPMEYKNKKKQYILDQEKIDEGVECIKRYINDFDYITYLEKIQDKESLRKLYDCTNSSIIKLQILRMLINIAGDRIENQVFWDYLTEYYHVENNEMTSLDDKRFDIIPNYIMNMADEIIDKIFK